MATAKVSPLSSHTQFPIEGDPDNNVIALHMAIIQQPVRKWQKPWRHQRAIVLFAGSAEETKLRLQLEGRIRSGEHLLQIIAVGGDLT